MEKRIYEKPTNTAISPEYFRDYVMANIKGATLIKEMTENNEYHGAVLSKNFILLYHVEPEGVTLLYERDDREQTTVDIFGPKYYLNGLEKKVNSEMDKLSRNLKIEQLE